MKRSKTVENYERALGIINKILSEEERIDITKFLLILAQDHPGELVSTYYKMSSSLRNRIIIELRDKKKIPAIKMYRDETKVSLKEAKDAVEKIAEEENIIL